MEDSLLIYFEQIASVCIQLQLFCENPRQL